MKPDKRHCKLCDGERGERMWERLFMGTLYAIATLTLLVVLFAGSQAQAEGFYVAAGVAAHQKHSARYDVIDWPFNDPTSVTGITWRKVNLRSLNLYDANEVRNPYGTVSVGYLRTIGRFSVDFKFAAHRSSFRTHNDRGLNSAELELKYFLFQ